MEEILFYYNSTIGKNMKKFSTSVSNLSQIFEINNKILFQLEKIFLHKKQLVVRFNNEKNKFLNLISKSLGKKK